MKFLKISSLALLVLLVILAVATYAELQPFSDMNIVKSDIQTAQVVDRHNVPLSVTYQNRWNSYDYVPLHKIPEALTRAFTLSEDRHFYEHGGIDWAARAKAVWDTIRYQRASRGASTLSEQVVRMLHPRPRTLWSKWIETIEVFELERQFNKSQILEFYLNEVPYASNRRGVVQGARHYFNRDMDTLSLKEMLALVVLARAPSRYDLYKNTAGIETPIERLAQRMREEGFIGEVDLSQKLELAKSTDPVNASHFVTYVRNASPATVGSKIHTTLDSQLQAKVQGLLDQRVKSLQAKNLHNGAVLVMDHQTGEILAWVVAGANRDPKVLVVPADQIDAVTTLRQPGSSMKPFLYALALDAGWTDQTIIEDSPLAKTIGDGYHQFANYSHKYYGKITLRQALGNSLNIPALRTIQFTGVGPYLNTLRSLGFSSLKESKDFYEEGLALGTGEVTLLELVQAYSALAQQGFFRPTLFVRSNSSSVGRRVFSENTSAIIGDILSDAKARQLEFGQNSVQNLPVQTAVKTGTSSDYHDAWAIGYNYRYVVGVWMGNLDRTPTEGVSGALGPALTLRSIFGELTRYEVTQGLTVPSTVVPAQEAPGEAAGIQSADIAYKIAFPISGMQIAIDPRVPHANQKLPLRMTGLKTGDKVAWLIDGQVAEHSWQLKAGEHAVSAVVNHPDNRQTKLAEVRFLVK